MLKPNVKTEIDSWPMPINLQIVSEKVETRFARNAKTTNQVLLLILVDHI